MTPPATSQPSGGQNTTSRRRALIGESQAQQTQLAPRTNLEKIIKGPNGRNIALIRTNNKARWNFKNSNNGLKYNLNGRNTNTPTIRNVNVGTGDLFKQTPTTTIYQDYPALTRIRNVLNSVQNTENSTGKAQYKILQTSLKPNKFGGSRTGPWFDTFPGWAGLNNDPRLSAAQKKTVQKILVSLKVPARDNHRNRPPLNFNINQPKFLNAKGQPNIAKINAAVRARRVKTTTNPLFESNNSNTFHNAKQNSFPVNENQVQRQARQHRQAFGN